MISFILTSVNEDYEYLNETFAQIDKVCNNYEIVFVSDREYTNDWVGNVNYIHTDLETSVKNYNEGVRQSKGDIVLVTADDHFILEDPSQMFKSKTQSLNIGEPWKINNSFLVGCRGFRQSIVEPWLDPWEDYLVTPFPVFNREVLDITDGVIFNESFRHHWVDHWLGYFLKKKSGTSIILDPPPSILNQRKVSFSNTNHDEHDVLVLKKLIDYFKEDPEMSYNTLV